MRLITQFAEAALQGMALVFMGEDTSFVLLPLLTNRLSLSMLACCGNVDFQLLSMRATSKSFGHACRSRCWTTARYTLHIQVPFNS